MKRVLVIGSGGAGKSTFARRLGEKLGLPVIHLDRVYWRADWVEPPKEEWRRKVEELCAREAWVIDGNYSGTLDIRLNACDAVIFLDLPRALCLWRVSRRALRYKGVSRPDMAEGCREQLNRDFLTFLLWVWNYPRHSRPKLLKRLEEFAGGKQIYRLRSSAEAEKFLAEVG
jgi:adenylate kinase family enzyme